jgi:hypothetical protein
VRALGCPWDSLLGGDARTEGRVLGCPFRCIVRLGKPVSWFETPLERVESNVRERWRMTLNNGVIVVPAAVTLAMREVEILQHLYN